jgi:enolase
MAKIKKIMSREILDSRGYPTVETKVVLEDEHYAVASVPSGASTGTYEAFELRDRDPMRFAGLGVLKAVNNVSQVIGPKIIGIDASDQKKIDETLINLDGSENKQNLGANAILSVSIACAKAQAASLQLPIYRYIAEALLQKKDKSYKIPTPLFNILNGGKHGAGNLEFQEFLIMPSQIKPYPLGLQIGTEIYYSLKKVLDYKNAIHSLGDEGGYAPNLYTNADALEIMTEAISQTPYVLGKDVFLGIDIAAGHFMNQEKRYTIKDRSNSMSSQELIEFYKDLTSRYLLLLLEDPLGEDEWEGWVEITKNMGGQLLIVSDDLTVTNKKLLEKAIQLKAANTILTKPNQIGTLSETLDVVNTAFNAKWKVIISHRSGDTTDDFAADLAVAVGADYVKFGAPARGERVVKYNRLSEIYNSLIHNQQQ